MIVTKLYKYDSSQENNSYRGEDFSDYIMLADSDKDTLDETLDEVELTLTGLPFQEEFAPSTKFIYEKWEEIEDAEGNKTLQLWKDWHLCVVQDLVSQPILSDDAYFNHNITFNEASVVAQHRLVDNIAVTYKVKDVTLDGKSPINPNEKARVILSDVKVTPSSNFKWATGNYSSFKFAHQYIWRFPTWVDESLNEDVWKNFDYYKELPLDEQTQNVTFPIPMLEIQMGVENTKTFEKQGFCSLDVVVTETDVSTSKQNILIQKTILPSSKNANENYWTIDFMSDKTLVPTDWRRDFKGWTFNRRKVVSQTIVTKTTETEFKQFALYDTEDAELSNRSVTFSITPNKRYDINVILHNYSENYKVKDYLTFVNDDVPLTIETDGQGKRFQNYSATNNQYPLAQLSFVTYLEGQDKKIWLKSAPAENAYNLYQKAQINTQNVKKIQGLNILETPQAFYLSQKDKQDLSNTTVIENFYNQKNWWEMQLEIGKYIHAIPKVRFGSDDRFITTWKKLGQVPDIIDNFNSNSHKISIFNSKSIENYIASCSSYITNMVQLGGIIDEWVAPKSSSEDYLVYNDVAGIIVSKPIIEIVDLQAKCINENSYGINVNEIRDLAGKGISGESPNGFVFEQNIYQLLPIVENAVVPTDYTISKGYAIYYALGDNKIQGFNYQLPTVNAGDPQNDYSIKRIIGRVFGVTPDNWKQIKVNDFVFHIIYRTKDTVRSDQTRPDLRKYLLNSKYDKVPQHSQFNNQTDTVVDSVKFGNNIYGKLIRTGNTEYTITEWVDSLFSLKQSGELYRINGELYYVSQVRNTYFKDYVISQVIYSKDYNQLSEIIGIPSEPRFYEISEQSLIQREISLNDFIVLGTTTKSEKNPNSFIRNKGWGYIRDLLFGNQEAFPKYAITIFKNDSDRKYGDVLGNETFYKEVCHPISTYSIENSLTLEWDMVDNFSAGDKVSKTTNYLEPTKAVDTAYNSLEPVQYTDAFGRSDLIDFLILNDLGDLTADQILDFPNSPIRTRTEEQIIGTEEEIAKEMTKPYIGDYSSKYLFGNELLEEMGDNQHGLGLIKDNREQISCNYNLQVITDSDRFVLSAYLWKAGKSNLKLALLNEEVNKISNDTIPDNSIIPNQLYDFTATPDTTNGIITIDISTALNNVDISGVKAIAIISTNEVNDIVASGAKYFVCARNISDLNEDDAKSNWYISNFDKTMFKHQ